jgi:alpha-1,6-mannosyltransferase
MRIVRLANFVAPHSGGLRTSLAELGAGYLAAGHEPVLVIPGERDSDQPTAQGRVITLRAPRVPFAGGYRVLWRRRRLTRLLTRLRPDVLEVSDRTTLRWTGAWAREHGVPAVMVSHESVTALLKGALPGVALSGLGRAVADWLNRRTARAYQQVICTTGWAAAEFERIGAGNVVRVPLGVDLATFTPRAIGSGQVRTRDQILLVHCGRLSAEKKPQRSLTTLATLRASGLPVRLVVAGDGPLRPRLERRAVRTGLPVTFVGFLPGRAGLAALLASADVALAPGPAETFRARRARGAGLRDPGGGERGIRPARGGGRSRGQRARPGPRGRRAYRAGPAGTPPPGRGPGPGRAIRLGHGRTRLPRRARCGSGQGRG